MPKETKKTVKKVEKKTVKKEAAFDLNADVYNLKGEKVGKVNLPKEVFGVKVNEPLLAQSVRIYLENQRLGTRKAKTRSEVSGSTKKLFRQKGTGRARAGSIKSPIQVGGGIVHGPRPYDYHLNLSKKMKKIALFSALTQKYQTDKIRFINSMDDLSPKTKNMVGFLKSMALFNKNKKIEKSTLLVTNKSNKNIFLAGRNLENFEITQISQLNTYQVLKNNNLLFLKNSLEFFTPKKENESAKVSKKKTTK